MGFTHTWGLGGMSVVLFLILVVTGILLMLGYEPFPGQAYDSIVILQKDVLFGQLVRNIHHWSGNILLIVSVLHLLRVYFTNAFYETRRLNWIIGLGLLLFVLASNFTGYLLPWDQRAYWTVTICAGMLEYLPFLGHWLQRMIIGGEEVGGATLSLFFTVHVVVMPICFFLLMPYHFWLVRKAGGVVVPRSPGTGLEKRPIHVPTVPHLITREISAGLILIACVMVYALIFDAPLEGKANPGLSPNPAKAPWYLMGVQELFMHFHPLFAVWIIPFITTVAIVILPYFRYDPEMTGVWFCSHTGRRMASTAAVMALVLTPVAVVSSSLFMDFAGWLPHWPAVISNGMMPLLIILGAFVGLYVIMKKHYKPSKNEAFQTLFIFMLIAYIILTTICYVFRGPGMALGWAF